MLKCFQWLTFSGGYFWIYAFTETLCRCIGCFSWGKFISIISLIILLLCILFSLFVFFRSYKFILPHDICLYSLVCICELIDYVLSLFIIHIYVNNYILISKFSFLLSILIIFFESLLFLFFLVLIASPICLSLSEVFFFLIF